jgi:alkaline phosphatase D
VNAPAQSHAGASRRTLLRAGAALAAAPWLLRSGRAADLPRFALGVASGQPRADGMVLWTLLTGPALPERVPVQWELARDEGFRDVVARGEEVAEAAWAHSVHAEPAGLAPDRWYWYRFRALGAQSMVGRTRTAPAPDAAAGTLDFAIASCQRFDVGHYAAWRHMADEKLDLVMFLGDYIYEYPSGRQSVRPVEGSGLVRTLEQYRARYATHKSDPALQAIHAQVPWLLVWDDHEVGNDYAGLQGQNLESDFPAQRAAAYQAYWEHMPFPKSARPRDGGMRIAGRLDWGALARIHLLDDRQYRDPQVCPKPSRGGGSNTVALADCPQLLDPKRTLLGGAQERWLADGWDAARPWNLVAQQTLMARFAWSDPTQGGTYWTDGWDGYAPARRRLLDGIAERKLGGAVVLGGDVHSNYVADLKLDFDDAAAPTIATEYCGTSITSLGQAQSRIDAALRFNPHIRYGRSDQRGYMRFALDAKRLQAQLRVLDDARNPASAIATAARFTTEAGRPGAQPA